MDIRQGADTLVLYYTGTGNSEYVAKKIREQIEDEVINLFDKIKKHDYSEMHSDRPFVFVYPTYAWQMPRILRDFIRQTGFIGNKCAYFVTTCGDSMGNTPKYLKRLCEQKKFTYMGCAEVIMPENYIAMFNAPEKPEAVPRHRRYRRKDDTWRGQAPAKAEKQAAGYRWFYRIAACVVFIVPAVREEYLNMP